MKTIESIVARSVWPGIAALSLGCLWLSSGALSAQPAAPAAPKSAQPIQEGAESLQGIVLVPRLEDVNRAGVTGLRGVQIKGPAFLQGPELTSRLKHYLHGPLTKAALDQMQVDIIKYCREKGHLVVDVFFPEEEIQEGTIQIAVIEAKIGKITATYEGGKWFSTNLVLGQLHLHPGQVVVSDQLNDNLNWLNRNTYQSLGYFDGAFRQVNASFQQGELGETDLKLEVKDRLPLRVFAGYEDSGIKVIGDDRFDAGFTWANAFGLDQRLNYQYVTDTGFNLLKEHVASYVIPLPWHHEFTVFGAYADMNPDLSLIDPDLSHFRNSGNYYQLSGRYNIPLPEVGNYDQEIVAGVDYKNTDTPLIFGPNSGGILTTGKVAVVQFSLGYNGSLKDKWGKNSFSVSGVYSPGNLVDNNDYAAFKDFTSDRSINPEYIYGKVDFRRETRLPGNFTWYLRAMGQLSDADLLPTETIGLGGYDTVRGYDERIVSGDNGWLVVNELRTPRIQLWNITRQKGEVDWIQGLVFCDYGGIMLRNPQPGYNANEQLLSVGAGVRFQVAHNLSLRFDYGFQLDRDYANQPTIFVKNEPSSRMHLGLELSY
jgi:hemolysin activation/secretion protein